MKIVLCLSKQSQNPETNNGRTEGTPPLIPPKKSLCVFNTGTNAETSCSLVVFVYPSTTGLSLLLPSVFTKRNGDVVVVVRCAKAVP